ncbi:MAG: 3-phosphoshikimate 1-carboxyvinyltransferase [Clostridia bacterium]|nr:3-phosphoshikimate 1-carboxyvinyltransferase [Clostridia bacterium]
MTVYIEKSRASGSVAAPPSKSFIHRMMICAALSGGECVINNVTESDDVLATADCVRSLGAGVRIADGTAYIRPGDNASDRLYCRQSGSTLRFFIPVCLASGGEYTFYGDETLLRRPLSVYEKLCAEQGLPFEYGDGSVTVRGPLDMRELTVSGAVSSQFISGLMLAAPLTGKDCTIRVIPPFYSRPYVDITAQVMKLYGVGAGFPDENTVTVKGGQRYTPADCTAEGDWSGAALLYTLGALNGDVSVTGLNGNSAQGDRAIIKQLEALKAGAPRIDISDCPDNAPALMAAAAALNGATLTGTSRLKIKESDRGAAMAEELMKFGAKVRIYKDAIKIRPGIKKPDTAICGHNDHRIVMACSVLLTLTGGQIQGAEAVNKSYPGFFDDLSSLHVKLRQG